MGIDKNTGYQGKFTLNGVEYAIRRFNVRTDPNKRSTTSSDDSGYTNVERTNLNATGRIEAYHSNDQVLVDVPGIKSGSTIENVRLFPVGLSSDPWFFPKAFIDQVEHDVDIEGDNVWTFNFENKGVFYEPGTAP